VRVFAGATAEAVALAAFLGTVLLIARLANLAIELEAARRNWPKDLEPPILAAAWWVFDLRTAQQITNVAIASDLRLARKDGPRLAVTIAEAIGRTRRC
jgi:hypothetical protein